MLQPIENNGMDAAENPRQTQSEIVRKQSQKVSADAEKLLNEEAEGRTVIAIADFICDRLSDAVSVYIRHGGKMEFFKCLDAIGWKRKGRGLPIDIPNVPGDLRVRCQFFANDNHLARKWGDFIDINISGLKSAKSPEEMRKWQESMMQVVHHEAEHIFHEGADLESEDLDENDSKIIYLKYLTNPGEIRAHARESAYLYHHAFPTEKFDLTKLQEITRSHPNLRLYWTRFLEADAQETWQKEKFDLRAVHEELRKHTEHFLQQYRHADGTSAVGTSLHIHDVPHDTAHQSTPRTSGMDQIAGVGMDDEDFHVRFSIKDLITVAQRHPVTDVSISLLIPMLEGRQEDPNHTEARAQEADLRYPIIVFANDEGHIFAIGDGTHRVQKAHVMGLGTIKAHVIPKSEMQAFAVRPEHTEKD